MRKQRVGELVTRTRIPRPGPSCNRLLRPSNVVSFEAVGHPQSTAVLDLRRSPAYSEILTGSLASGDCRLFAEALPNHQLVL